MYCESSLGGADAYTYRGQVLSQDKGIWPVLGLGYDWGPFITMDVGIVGYRQDSLLPQNSLSPLKISPFIGISLEMDVHIMIIQF